MSFYQSYTEEYVPASDEERRSEMRRIYLACGGTEAQADAHFDALKKKLEEGLLQSDESEIVKEAVLWKRRRK